MRSTSISVVVLVAGLAVAGLIALCAAAAGSWLGAALALLLAMAVAAAVAWWRGGWQSRHAPGDQAAEPATPDVPHAASAANAPRAAAAVADLDDLVVQMLAHDRYALLLRPQIAHSLHVAQLAAARTALEVGMSLVPAGDVLLRPEESQRDDDLGPAAGTLTSIEAALLDRYPVTNAQFQCFVDAGGYETPSLWDDDVAHAVFEFVDTTGAPGPRFWAGGEFSAGLADHPVVGVSWYEARAYARWVGKRLPSDAEWVKAGAWPIPIPNGKPVQRKFPWGDSWEPDRANVWATGPGKTAPVEAYADGGSIAGVYGLIGNVWEWTNDTFVPAPPPVQPGRGPQSWPAESFRSLRGGAFDTYFERQASCQFASGDSPLARKHNIGFRCALGLAELSQSADAPEEPAAANLFCEAVG